MLEVKNLIRTGFEEFESGLAADVWVGNGEDCVIDSPCAIGLYTVEVAVSRVFAYFDIVDNLDMDVSLSQALARVLDMMSK